MNFTGESPQGPPKEKVSTLPFETKFSGKGTVRGQVSEKLEFRAPKGQSLWKHKEKLSGLMTEKQWAI